MSKNIEFKNTPIKVWDSLSQLETGTDIPESWKAESKSDENILIGYAAKFGGDPDNGGDIIHQGAFTKTILERVPAGKVSLTDTHDRSIKTTIGVVVEAIEDSYGLLIKARFATTQDAQDVRTKAKEGIVNFLSIGYNTLDCEYKTWEGVGEWKGALIRHIKTVRLVEVAMCTTPCNEGARILNVKSLSDGMLPLAPATHSWDSDAARTRVKEFAKANQAQFSDAFLVIDRKAADFESACQGFICDVIDNSLVAVPNAVRQLGFNIVESKSKGQSVAPGLEDSLSRYYQAMGEIPPFRYPSADVVLAKAESGLHDIEALSGIQNRLNLIMSRTERPLNNGPENPSVKASETDETKDEDLRLRARLAAMNFSF